MGSIALAEQLNLARVAIIGAGPSGLAAAKYLLAEKKFSKIQIFEQRATPGGVWNHTPHHQDPNFAIPRVTLKLKPDQLIWPEGSQHLEFLSPMYDLLETNIPFSLMNYTDKEFPEGSALFPRHSAVLDYLKEYAKEVAPLIKYETQVLDVKKSSSSDGAQPWEVETVNLRTQEATKSQFDAVIVASGNYNDPFVPDIPGLVEFDKAYPDTITHSKFYRRPDAYSRKKVVVVGNSASGVDISMQLSATAKLPVFVSEKEKPSVTQPAEEKPWAAQVPEIAEFLIPHRAVRFSNGQIEKDIDAVIFCTGFHYSYPFLRSLEPSINVRDGSHAAHLWEQILYTADPTLAFLAVPQRIIPFPVAEAQSAVIARIWSGRLNPPSRDAREQWVKQRQESTGGGKAVHLMSSGEDVNYINRLFETSASAAKKPGLENGGDGKRPPFWGEEKRWTRERVPKIKVASRAVGDKRHELRKLEDLGFDYAEWKMNESVLR